MWPFKEKRQTATQSDADFFARMGWTSIATSAAGVSVSVDSALGVPAVWAAVNFLSGTIAGLPLQVFRKSGEKRTRIKGGLSDILAKAVNDGMSSFEWRKYTFDNVFTGGRGVSYIERNGAGNIVNLFPIDPSGVTVKMSGGRKTYIVGQKTYLATEILDIPFMLKPDNLSHRGPIMSNRDAIGQAIAAQQYGGKAFSSGGIPPLSMQGPFKSGASASRASDDIAQAMQQANNDGRNVLVMPIGHELKPVGIDPDKMQMVEAQRFSIEQIARIYSLPPVFLQDLTNGTFSNTEQQDLFFVKHTVKRWVEQVEQEMNLKFFGRSGTRYVEFNLDGLLRGDFKTRMEGYSTAIQNAMLTPNEVRNLENRPEIDKADDLLIQGATVPLGSQPMNKPGDPNG